MVCTLTIDEGVYENDHNGVYISIDEKVCINSRQMVCMINWPIKGV